MRIATDLRHTIHERFAEAGIEIPFPQHVLHMADRDVSGESPNNQQDDGEGATANAADGTKT